MGSGRNANLDLLRGLSALAVMVGHLRGFYFGSWHPSSGDGWFYFWFDRLTSLQTPAVKVFFVLSGYWVGGWVLRTIREGNWSWTRYLTLRMTRLYVVLVPALFLTLAFDLWGKTHGDFRFYRGADLGLGCFLKNALFLQGFLPPIYGTNAPLWSLCYEFWYYVLFPLAVLLFQKDRSGWKRNATIVLFLAGGVALPWKFWAGGVFWLAGAGAWWVMSDPRWGRWVRSPWVFLLSTLAFIAGLDVYLRFGGGRPFVWLDILIVLGAGGMIPFLSARDVASKAYQRVSEILSDVSYTLYATHFPLLLFLLAGWETMRTFEPTPQTLWAYSGWAVLCLGLAVLLWWVFERRTPEARRWVADCLARQGWGGAARR